jgi:GH15 family glucan-1,4-alpha-glucosidase
LVELQDPCADYGSRFRKELSMNSITRIDRADIRDFGPVVTDGYSFFSEEKRDTKLEVAPLANGIPGYRLTDPCKEGRYRIKKTVLVDPLRDSLVAFLDTRRAQNTGNDSSSPKSETNAA